MDNNIKINRPGKSAILFPVTVAGLKKAQKEMDKLHERFGLVIPSGSQYEYLHQANEHLWAIKNSKRALKHLIAEEQAKESEK